MAEEYSISQLTEDLSAADSDLLEVSKDNGDGTYTSRKQTRSTLLDGTVTQEELDAHEADTTNPHQVTKEQVGLSNVPNVDARARSSHTGTQPASTISDFSTAADARISAQKGQNNGLATLDSSGKVPSVQLPSYVDDVLEYANVGQLPATRETGKIYITIDTGKTYRWSGSAYVEISPSPGSTDAVPEGATDLYFTTGRAASAAPVQSVAGKTGAVVLTKSDVGLGIVDNTADSAKPVSTATQAALNTKADTNHIHDDRYYREDEVDTLLQTKANASDIPSTIVQSVVAGANVTIDASDPENPVISASGGGGGGAVDSVNGQTGVVVLDADAIDDTSTDHKFTTSSEKSKLAGIEAGAQVNEVSAADISDFETTTQLNARDTANRSRANHTGEQAISTVTGLQAALDGKATTSHHHDASYAPLEHDHALADVTGLQTALDAKADESALATVATSGSYNDLSDTPSIPTVPTSIVESVVAGTNVTIDNTDPANPVISASGGGGGTTLPHQTGNAGKYLKTDGSALSWDTPAGGGGGGSVTPKMQIDSVFESLDPRFTKDLGAGSSASVGGTGLTVSCGSNTTTGYASISLRNNADSFEGNINLGVTAGSYLGTNDSFEMYFGVGQLVTNGAGINMTGKHFGWYATRQSATNTYRYTCADGTTQASGTYTGTGSNTLHFIEKANSSVKYYQNGTLIGTLTTNIPTGTTLWPFSISMSNRNSGVNNGVLFAGFSHERDAY